MVALISGSDVRDPRKQLALSFDPSVRGLAQTHALLCAVQQAQRLLISGRFDPDQLGRDGMGFVLAFAGYDDETALKQAISDAVARSEAEIDRILTAK